MPAGRARRSDAAAARPALRRLRRAPRPAEPGSRSHADPSARSLDLLERAPGGAFGEIQAVAVAADFEDRLHRLRTRNRRVELGELRVDEHAPALLLRAAAGRRQELADLAEREPEPAAELDHGQLLDGGLVVLPASA